MSNLDRFAFGVYSRIESETFEWKKSSCACDASDRRYFDILGQRNFRSEIRLCNCCSSLRIHICITCSVGDLLLGLVISNNYVFISFSNLMAKTLFTNWTLDGFERIDQLVIIDSTRSSRRREYLSHDLMTERMLQQNRKQIEREPVALEMSNRQERAVKWFCSVPKGNPIRCNKKMDFRFWIPNSKCQHRLNINESEMCPAYRVLLCVLDQANEDEEDWWFRNGNKWLLFNGGAVVAIVRELVMS